MKFFFKIYLSFLTGFAILLIPYYSVYSQEKITLDSISWKKYWKKLHTDKDESNIYDFFVDEKGNFYFPLSDNINIYNNKGRLIEKKDLHIRKLGEVYYMNGYCDGTRFFYKYLGNEGNWHVLTSTNGKYTDTIADLEGSRLILDRVNNNMYSLQSNSTSPPPYEWSDPIIYKLNLSNTQDTLFVTSKVKDKFSMTDGYYPDVISRFYAEKDTLYFAIKDCIFCASIDKKIIRRKKIQISNKIKTIELIAKSKDKFILVGEIKDPPIVQDVIIIVDTNFQTQKEIFIYKPHYMNNDLIHDSDLWYDYSLMYRYSCFIYHFSPCLNKLFIAYQKDDSIYVCEIKID